MSQWDNNEVQRQLEARRGEIEDLNRRIKILQSQLSSLTTKATTKTDTTVNGAALPYLSTHGVVLGQGGNPPISLNPGAVGYVLTSNGTNLDPSYQAASHSLLIAQGGMPADYTFTTGMSDISLEITISQAGVWLITSLLNMLADIGDGAITTQLMKNGIFYVNGVYLSGAIGRLSQNNSWLITGAVAGDVFKIQGMKASGLGSSIIYKDYSVMQAFKFQ